MKSNGTYKAVIIASLLVIPFATGCGKPKSYSPPASAATEKKVPDLPEAHGPMTWEEPKKEEGTPSAENCANGQCTPVDEPVVLPTVDVPVSKRHPLCQDAYDPKKPQPEGIKCPKCQEGKFTQKDPGRAEIDILFVADTSPSLETERAAIARGVRKFVDALPPETDYRFAVMAAHAPVGFERHGGKKSSSGLAGKLLTTGGGAAVLKPSDYRNWSQFNQVLAQRLTKTPSEPATDGGEVGLLSLEMGISGSQLIENRRLGFFRKDAALAIIFISDENDLCSAEVNYPQGVVAKPNVDKFGKTEFTVEEVANEVYCRNPDNSRKNFAESVFVKLRQLQQKEGKPDEANPLLVSGILYTEESSVPTQMAPDEKFPMYFPENEKGYGYLDVIEKNQGVAVDIAKGNFDEGLRSIGEAAALKLEVKDGFKLKDGVEVDPNTICVLVDGKEVQWVPSLKERVPGLSYTYQADLREVHLRGIGARNSQGKPSQVNIFYCEPRSVIEFSREELPHYTFPTAGEHYRNLLVPKGCKALRERIQRGELDTAE